MNESRSLNDKHKTCEDNKNVIEKKKKLKLAGISTV